MQKKSWKKNNFSGGFQAHTVGLAPTEFCFKTGLIDFLPVALTTTKKNIVTNQKFIFFFISWKKMSAGP